MEAPPPGSECGAARGGTTHPVYSVKTVENSFNASVLKKQISGVRVNYWLNFAVIITRAVELFEEVS